MDIFCTSTKSLMAPDKTSLCFSIVDVNSQLEILLCFKYLVAEMHILYTIKRRRKENIIDLAQWFKSVTSTLNGDERNQNTNMS